jgi:acyl-CoA synthetase (AMP-forming)/AMP-acid ligase II
LEADFSPQAVATLLALAKMRAITVLVTRPDRDRRAELADTCHVQHHIYWSADGQFSCRAANGDGRHELFDRLRATGSSGIVLFTSGSTGKSKAVVHDLDRLLSKFARQPRPLRTLAFYVFDHIGAMDVLLSTLYSGGCLAMVEDRSPDHVLAASERHRVELWPVPPTFLRLVLLSEAHLRHRVTALRTIAFGAEPMPAETLDQVARAFPQARLIQTFGMSELGTLRSQTKDSDAKWIRLANAEQEVRVVDGILQVKSPTAMLGYLNAPAPFTDDGWFITGDVAEVDDHYLRVLGRKSEAINVGGEKVFPAEVEGVLLAADGVADATVYGEPNAITGNIVCARVTPSRPEDRRKFTAQLKQHCRARLAPYKVPVRIVLEETSSHGPRFKKKRLPDPLPSPAKGSS